MLFDLSGFEVGAHEVHLTSRDLLQLNATARSTSHEECHTLDHSSFWRQLSFMGLVVAITKAAAYQ